MPSVISSIASPSLWGPPTTWTRTRGLRATKAAAPGGRRRGRGRGGRPGQAIARTAARRDRLEDVDGGTDREPGERVGRQGEERAVGAGGFGPGDVGEGGVGGRRRRRVDVGVEAVQDSEPGVVDVAVDVVGEQRRQAGKERRGGRRSPPRSSAGPVAAPRRARRGRRRSRPRSGVGNPGARLSYSLPASRRPAPPPPTSAAGGGGRHRSRFLAGTGRVGVGVVAAGHFFAQFAGRCRLRLRLRHAGVVAAVAARRRGGELAEERRPADRRLGLARIPRRGLPRRSRASARSRPGRCRRRR